jgi:hypothetical protein
MSVTLESTTDSKEQVLAAAGNLAQKKESVESNSESEAKEIEASDENSEESETSEEQESTDDESDNEFAESEEKEGEEEPEKEKPKKKNKGFKKRIDKLRGELSAKDQEINYLKQLALDKASARENPIETQKKSEAKLDGKPLAEKFDTHDEYLEALTDWKLEQRETERENKKREVELKTQQQSQAQSFQAKVKDFAKSTEDFNDVVSEVDDITLTPGLQEVLISSEVGPELMYELAKNRKELERINALGPLAAAREIGKIEARLSKAHSPSKEAKQTKAPQPISPVGNKGSGKPAKSPENMNFGEYKKWRESRA